MPRDTKLKEYASTVTIHEQTGQVLLILREDFRIWALPGGGLNPGETSEQAAVRETLEETGYTVAIARYVGCYHRPQRKDVRQVYLAHPRSDQPATHDFESADVRWFPVDALPSPTAPNVAEIIRDALVENAAPVQREILMSRGQALALNVLIFLRDLRNVLMRRK